MRLTVLGGTGFAGSAVVREAAARGHEVTSVSRREAEQRLPGVTYVIGSVLDPSLLASALEGRDAVLETVSPRGDMAGKVEGLVDALIDRAEQQGFRLGVLGGVSSVLVAAGGPTLFEVRPPAAEIMPEVRTGMALKEQLERSPEGVDWFYVSPAASFGAWAQVPDTGAYRVSEDVLLTDGEGNSAISAADLAKAIVDELEQPRFRRRRLHVAH